MRYIGEVIGVMKLYQVEYTGSDMTVCILVDNADYKGYVEEVFGTKARILECDTTHFEAIRVNMDVEDDKTFYVKYVQVNPVDQVS